MGNCEFHSAWQHSIASSISCEGIGLHSGQSVEMTLCPADANTGISFVRSDIPSSDPIPANALLVGDTKLGTSLIGHDGTAVATIEHIMAALWGAGIDNITVILNAAEVPIMDGSSKLFMQMIQQAGLQKQYALREFMEITESCSVQIGESIIEISPHRGFVIDTTVNYDHPQITTQTACYDFEKCGFGDTLAEARTFGFAHEVEIMRKMGLIRGGSMDNAIVLGEREILNPEGLRFNDEFVRHKALDCVGDLFLTGKRIKGYVKTYKPGHSINTAIAKHLLQNPEKWQLVTNEQELEAATLHNNGLVPAAEAVFA